MAEYHLIARIRERLRKEIGTVYKPHAGRLRVALAFPNTYYVGMSNLGFQLVYRLLNDRDDVVCERVFLPDPEDMETYRRSGVLCSYESQTPVHEFDVVAFSLSYELDYPNMLRILALAGVQEMSAVRTSEAPIVIAGGPAATFNPEPMSSYTDAFVIGEAEEVLPEMISLIADGLNGDRDNMLLRMAHVPGIYVPRFYEVEYNADGTVRGVRPNRAVPERIRRRWVRSLDAYSAISAILTPDTEFSNMILAEIARGCGRQCRFCVAGHAFLPPRARSAEAVLESVRMAEEKAAARSFRKPRVGLLSASVFDHPSAMLICQSLLERDRLFSISSTRADTLNRDIAAALHQGGHETLTIAPEAGTDRLRQVINKAMTDEDVLHAAAIAWDGGFRRLKLYFMIGLPTESADDVEGIVSIVSRIAKLFLWEKIGVSISCFVPKPWTPFQWAGMEEEKRLADKLSYLRRSLRKIRGVEFACESAREAVVQGVLARGDRRVGEVLSLAAREGVNWRAAFRAGDVDPAFYAQRCRSREEVFPWDHLDLGVRKEYLWEQYSRAMGAALTPPCAPGKCRRCGVCQ